MMAKQATSIYIDSSAVWVLVARGKQPRKWASMPLERGLVKDGVIQEPNAVASKIKELWRTHKIGDRKVIAGVSGINCLYRSITLPELPRDLLPEAVKRETARILAVPLEQLYLSWQTLPALKGETKVYLAALPRNSIDALISTLRKAGLNPYLMDLKPLCLARTVTEPKAIIIDAQPTSFDIVIQTEAIPQVVRSLPLTEEDSLEEKIPIIREELDRAITFYNSSHMDKPIEASVPILVTGELAEHQDTWKLITGRQPHPVQVLPSLLETPEGFPSSQYMTNIGLALKEIGDKGATAYSLVNLNVFPDVYRPKPRHLSEILFVPFVVAGIALVVLGFYAYSYTSNRTTELRIELANISEIVITKRTQIDDLTALAEQVSAAQETANAFAATLDSFRSGRDEIFRDLGEINKLPGAIHLRHVIDDTSTLTVNGLGDDEDAIFSYARNLRASGRFTMVVITDMRQKDYQTEFTIILTKS